MEHRITIRDIAKKAGVHHTTISLALRNSPKLKKETRESIQALATSMGYTPDPVLSSLMAYRKAVRPPRYQETIAWINNWPKRRQPYAYFTGYHEGAVARARQLGYAIEEFWLREKGMSPEQLSRILKARNIRGLLLMPQPEAGLYLNLDFDSFSTVNFGFSFQPPIHHVVGNHHPHSIGLILKNLIELGYRRIGFYTFNEDWDERSQNAWLSGLLLAHWKHRSLKLLSPLLHRRRSVWNIEKWIEKDRPEVIVSHNGVFDLLKKARHRIPEEFGFAGLQLTPDYPDLAGIDQNDREIGMAAIDLLVGMLQRGERGIPKVPQRILIEGFWKPGKTVRPSA